jgi:hypothetical protein
MSANTVYFALETQQERESNNSYMLWYTYTYGQIFSYSSSYFVREATGNIVSPNAFPKYASELTERCHHQRKELQRIVEIIKVTTEIIDDIVYNILQYYLLLV